MEQLFQDSPTRSFRKGQILIYEGDNLEDIYYVDNGFVKAFDIRSSGDPRTIAIFTTGDAFPLSSILAGPGTSRYFYECMTDTKCQVLTKAKFQQRVRNNLEIGEMLIKDTSKLNQELIERIEILSAQSAHHKVVALLSYLAGKTGAKKGGKLQLQIPLTTQDIAELCSLTRETTSVQLIQLKKAGVIAGRRHLIVDPAKLTKLAQA